MHITTTRKQLFKLIAPFLLVLTLAAGTFIFYNTNRASVTSKLMALDLLPKPEVFTELYFNNSANLPDSATSNQAISFAFVIHNLEGTDLQYTYEISVNANGTQQIVDNGKVLVKNNQYFTRNEKFNLINVPGRQEVIVDLTNKQQSIDFWIMENK